jgi:hypothetical protein
MKSGGGGSSTGFGACSVGSNQPRLHLAHVFDDGLGSWAPGLTAGHPRYHLGDDDD